MNNREAFEKWFLKKYGWINTESWRKDFYEDEIMQDKFDGWNGFQENLGALQIAPDLKIYGTDEALTLAGKALAAYQKPKEIIYLHRYYPRDESWSSSTKETWELLKAEDINRNWYQFMTATKD